MPPKRKKIVISSSESSDSDYEDNSQMSESSSSATHTTPEVKKTTANKKKPIKCEPIKKATNKPQIKKAARRKLTKKDSFSSNESKQSCEIDEDDNETDEDDTDDASCNQHKRRKFNRSKLSLMDLLSMRDSDDTPDAIKNRVINAWVRGIKPNMRRKFRPMAEQIYDKITAMPKQSDILQSKMPFREKCALIEQMEMLGQSHPGTADYFALKKDIFRIMSSYENLTDNAKDLEQIDVTAEKLQADTTLDIPLRMKILKSDLSDHNKKILLDKYALMNTYCSDGNTYGKLYEWIEWGLAISDKVIPMPVKMADGPLAINKYLYNVKRHLDRKLYGMTRIKETLLELLTTRITNPNAKELSIGLLGAPGVGKCLAPDTPILLFHGGIVLAKDVKIGDIFIGDDNTSRKVLSVCNGIDQMYEIKTQHYGSFIVNEPHVLTLRNPATNVIIDIPLNEYIIDMKDPHESKYADYTMFTVPIRYKPRNIPDAEIATIAMKICKTLIDLRFTIELPNEYVYSDYRLRHGIISNILNYANVPLKITNAALANQLLFMCRSIGLIATYNNDTCILDVIDKYAIAHIKDDDIMSVSFSVHKVGVGRYCGFTLDGNGRFMLANCIITHNTHLVQVLAEAIELPFYKINMGGQSDSHQFLGHGFTYEGAQPGIIVKGLRQMKSKSGIIYLDEFDKIASQSGKVEQTFLHISDPVQQAEFQDHYMPEIKIDLSYMMFIYSFNFKENINPVLLDRIPIIEVPGYTAKDKLQIVKNYIVPDALTNIGMKESTIKFTDAAINYIIGSHTEEGMRRIKQDIHHIVKRINMINACSHPDGQLKLSYEIKDFKLPFTVTDDVIRKLENEKKKEKYLDLYI